MQPEIIQQIINNLNKQLGITADLATNEAIVECIVKLERLIR